MNLKLTIVSLAFLVQALAAQPLNYHPLSLTNTPYDERNPVISPDGKMLFMTIANHPRNIGGERDPGDIWYCTLNETNGWSEPVHAGAKINDRSFNSIAGFSSDGNEMVLMGHYDPSGSPARSQGIAVSRRATDGWSRPQNIAIPYFQNKSSLASGYITPDLNTLVYSAETYGTYGVEDLYVTQRQADGKWSAPKNLGSTINSPFQELAPSLSLDGKTLYFSTNGRRGKGSFDIYSSTRLDDTWLNWSVPENITSVNSPGRELYYRESAAVGYTLYTSTKDSDKYGDIKMFTPETPLVADSTQLVQASPLTLAENRPDIQQTDAHIVSLRGKVINAKTGQPVAATITFEPQSAPDGSPTPVNASTSGYSATLPSTSQYVVKVESKGFITSREKLDVQTLQMDNLEMNFTLQPIEVGTTVELKDVLFEQSKTILLPQSFAELNDVVEFMKANPKVRIELGGHTDNRGIPSQNVKLSQGRVDRVKEYLISKGIEKKRITGKGYGGARPVASNDNEDTRKLNRRVEFTISRN